MTVTVTIPTILRPLTDGRRSVAADGTTLVEVLRDVDSRHRGFAGRVLSPEGTLQRYVNVYVNDEDVRFTGALDTPVRAGDTVTILPAVAGGSR
ncbi:MAG TPA: MoaD/ThiS family protein [Pilimelia sp.]|nr:MoaD/ThiS family protein [Pilimelia sp.]